MSSTLYFFVTAAVDEDILAAEAAEELVRFVGCELPLRAACRVAEVEDEEEEEEMEKEEELNGADEPSLALRIWSE